VSGEYFIGVHERELERLREQHAAWLPETRALWKRAGFGAGQRLSDLGCGPGFSALELARVAGPSGAVVALDRARDFLDFAAREARRDGLDNVRTLEADLTRVERLDEPLDGAFCRWFLAFLVHDLARVLRCIHASLAPGGVLAAMEYLTVESATSSPPLRGFDAHTQAWVRYYRDHGGDTAVGRYLPPMLEDAGFRIESIQCVGGMAPSSHRWWRWWGRLIEDFAGKFAAEGLMSPEDVEHLRSDWVRASKARHAFIHTPVLVQIVARKA
jgi:ubiquinone/menaquinone biosynthesis C-methylase UbiE